MYGLVFEDQAAIPPASPNRMDIACFAGFVEPRANRTVSNDIKAWWKAYAWDDPRAIGTDDLLQVPVPIDSWEVFDRLFAWNTGTVATYLGAAVRSFFIQGGRRCFVVSAGRPPVKPFDADAETSKLIPGFSTTNFAATLRIDVMNRFSWRGIAHLLGLPEATMLLVPDLAWLFPPLPDPPAFPEFSTEGPAEFFECTQESIVQPPTERYGRFFRIERFGDDEYQDWAIAVGLLDQLISLYRPDAQVVLSVPLPVQGHPVERNPASALSPADPRVPRIRSRYVQVAYPWLRTAVSRDMPEEFEPPEGVLAGHLAHNALTTGAFHSAARQPLVNVSNTLPVLRRDLLMHADARLTVPYRISTFAPEARGIQLLSDVTTDTGVYRPASVQRLIAVVLRAARRVGEEVIFDNSGGQLWRTIVERMSSLLTELFQLGALRGDRLTDAFSVRCDRATMTESDLDNGRVIAEVSIQPSAPVQRITVVLALDQAAGASLVEVSQEAGVAA